MSTWQQQWQESFKSVDSLLDYLELSGHNFDVLSEHKPFLIRVPRAFAERMQKNNPADPLLLQVLPLQKELDFAPGYQHDPLAENTVNPIPGLLHKYYGRVLLTLTGACAVHCRYCFRRHFPYEKNNPGTKGWSLIFDYLVKHPEVNEVILSGGDPLSLDDDLLELFLDQLEAISTVKYLRFHTRLPIVLPARVTDNLVSYLKSLRFRTTIVLHSNHANEWDDLLKDSIKKFINAGIIVLNQAVLLHRVNDSVEALVNLSYRLYDCGVLPYYLHLLDKVSGAAHFEVSRSKAIELLRDITEKLPGYLVPKLVYEAPGKKNKVAIPIENITF